MSSFMKEFEHLKINLEDLKRATNNFGSKVIGVGGFGKVYEGEISHYKGRSIVAIKRLSRKSGQGDPEFFKEIMMLSRYSHKNLITLLGYCDDDGEKIIVYEHASNGSLDRHLNSNALTWAQRLKICLDVAKGLKFLHDHRGSQQRILHRDIKSANILLDENWNAKLSDMGLSKVAPANQQHSYLVTNVVGTRGYCDPQYMETYTLTKESDIYSFGVVLFEVLCGSLCFKMTNGQLEILVPVWKQNYIHKNLDRIIFKDIEPPMDPTSFKTFSDIAFQCLHYSREERPTTSLLVEKLEMALKCQERHDMKLAKYGYFDELLSKGKDVFFSSGKVTIIYSNMGMKKEEVTPPQVETARMRIIHFDGTMSFTLDDLLRASVEVMGRSTYGAYYKAKMENGDRVAVYRLGCEFTTNPTEFEVALNLLGKIRHPDLLAMRAYHFNSEETLNPKEKLLFYDYMHRGSLDTFLHDQRLEQPVDWPTRMKIAKGVARGLLILHTHHNLIHGNLTSSNVFLDDNNNPKISEFGLLQLLTAHPNMSAFARVHGINLKADTKTDIYSLGVIMLELLTRKSRLEVECLNLSRWVQMTIQTKGKLEVFDQELLRYSFFKEEMAKMLQEEMMKMLQLAISCVSTLPQDRPDVHMVLRQLEEISSETAPSSSDDGGAGPSSN